VLRCSEVFTNVATRAIALYRSMSRTSSVEQVWTRARHPGLSKPHEFDAVRRELDRLMADAVAATRVRHPQIAFTIDP
jgi:hypothetical protein